MRWCTLGSLATVVACASASTGVTLNYEPFYGQYEFDGSIYGLQTTPIAGTIAIDSLTYLIRTSLGASCTEDMPRQPRRNLTLTCGDLQLVLRRAETGVNPEVEVHAVVPEMTDHVVCTAYRGGVCIATRVVTEMAMVGRRGRAVLRSTGG